MTGSVPDAEDLVQETLIRAMEHPPADTSRDLRPWLVRVAMNLSRDLLRKRRRMGYPGMWLPVPMETEADESAVDDGSAPSPEARYGAMESASYAFLYALEALTPSQRAVLVLRDAFDFSSAEAAEALAMSEENVRITLHRARKAMSRYDENRMVPSRESADRAHDVLMRLFASIATNDLVGARALFATDARALSDGGGVQFAGKKPVRGADKIVQMYRKLATRASDGAQVELKTINGMPAMVGSDPGAKSPNAPRFLITAELDRTGKIRTLFSVLAPGKLREIFLDVAG
jgi:RNA polymerase sigma-70 factor (ECF subfamily)